MTIFNEPTNDVDRAWDTLKSWSNTVLRLVHSSDYYYTSLLRRFPPSRTWGQTSSPMGSHGMALTVEFVRTQIRIDDVGQSVTTKMHRTTLGYDQSDFDKYSQSPVFERLTTRVNRAADAIRHWTAIIEQASSQQKAKSRQDRKKLIAAAGGSSTISTTIPADVMGTANPALMSKDEFINSISYVGVDADLMQYHQEASPLGTSKIANGCLTSHERRKIGLLITKLAQLGTKGNMTVCYAAALGSIDRKTRSATQMYTVVITNDTGTIAWSSTKPKALVVRDHTAAKPGIRRININNFIEGTLMHQEAYEKLFKQL